MSITNNGQCFHCGSWHTGPCPRVKAIEYYENGMVKRVEYIEPFVQYSPPLTTVTIKPPEPT